MTKEQEAIEILNKFKNNEIQRDKLEISRGGGWKIGDIYKLLELNPAIETVLNMLKEKDRQIDLMAEEINETNRGYKDYCKFKIICDRNCKSCIKQYFERKVKND